MATRIYVGNLPYSADNQQLSRLFSVFGDVVEANVVMDRDTGQSKGFGFVEMASEEAARNAIVGLNGTMLGNRTIRVNEAQPRAERTPGQRPSGGYGREGYGERPRREEGGRGYGERPRREEGGRGYGERPRRDDYSGRGQFTPRHGNVSHDYDSGPSESSYDRQMRGRERDRARRDREW